MEAKAHIRANDAVPRARANPILAFTRSAILIPWTAWCYANVMLRFLIVRDHRSRLSLTARWTHRCYKVIARIVGFSIRVHDAPPKGAFLLTPNHLGYADIIVLGAVCPCFIVGKIDVESWPVIGRIFRTTYNIGVARNGSKGLLSALGDISDRLQAGHPVCVYLEGTSTGGGQVLPFHSPLLQPALESKVPVVPCALRWSVSKPAVDISEDVAYWKDHFFPSHFWRLLGLREIRVDVRFGQPATVDNDDRKALARKLRHEVIHMLESLAL